MAKIVRFFIQVPNLVYWYLLRYRTHLDIVPILFLDTGNIEVAPGGFLDFCLRFLYKVKIVKIKGSSWTKLFTPHERAIKTGKSNTFPVPRRHMGHEIQPINNDKLSLHMRSTQTASSK